MRNQLRYLSLIGIAVCISYIVLSPLESPSLWLILTYIPIFLNHLLVSVAKPQFSSSTNLIFASFTLTTLSTVSCIVGSFFYLYLSQINYSNKSLMSLMLYLQLSCLHSSLSSFELLSKPPRNQIIPIMSTNYL